MSCSYSLNESVTDVVENHLANIEEREKKLGFRPQKEIIYNSLLPYASLIDEESNTQLAEIKAQLGRAIILRDLKVAGLHWIGQLSKYTRLNGMKFSMEDHINFINLLFEVLVTPGMEYSLIQRYATSLTTLLRKKELIPRRMLVLDWKLLYRLMEGAINNRYEYNGLISLPENIEAILKSLIKAARVYFSVDCTKEMLDEWRPLMCPFDTSMSRAMYNFELFLPTLLYPEEYDRSVGLWFDEFMSFYCNCVSCPPWELNIVNLLTRLAHDCVGYINWEPYLDQIFTRFLRSFCLPVGSKKMEVSRSMDCYDVNYIARWIVYMLSSRSSTQTHISKLMKALESFYHPSNHGQWSNKMLKFLSRISLEFVRRLQKEKWHPLRKPQAATAAAAAQQQQPQQPQQSPSNKSLRQQQKRHGGYDDGEVAATYDGSLTKTFETLVRAEDIKITVNNISRNNDDDDDDNDGDGRNDDGRNDDSRNDDGRNDDGDDGNGYGGGFGGHGSSDKIQSQTNVRAISQKRKTWEPEIPQDVRLTESDITNFVECLSPSLMSAMFSKSGSAEAANTFKNLAMCRPELVIPPLLDWTYAALETLTEPHRLISCLQCTNSVIRSMMIYCERYPEGRLHVIPLLRLVLPGIDPNDIKKSLMTFQLISMLVSLLPIVDSSNASEYYPNLTEHERELCSATSEFEGVVLLFFDRVISLIESSSHQHTRTDSSAQHRMSAEEVTLELCVISSSNAMLSQTSLPIFQEVLKKIHNFAIGSVFEIRVAGRFASKLVKAAVKAQPRLTLAKFMPHCSDLIVKRLTAEDLSKEEHVDNEVLWHLMIISEISSFNGLELVEFKDNILSILDLTLEFKCKEVIELSGILLRNVLWALSSIYALDFRCTVRDWDQHVKDFLPINVWGRSSDIHNLGMKWHEPTDIEKEFVSEILQRYMMRQLEKIKNYCSADDSDMEREELQNRLNIIEHCVFGACALLPAWEDEAVKLVSSPVALTRFSAIAGNDSKGIVIDGRNVRVLVTECIRELLKKMLAKSEDDTKNLIIIIKIMNLLMHVFSSSKDDFDGRWKARRHIKNAMENKLLGKKRHIRTLLVDRIQLQHELRATCQSVKHFTKLHRDIFKDLLLLSVSHYMEVRKAAQASLNKGFRVFIYSYRSVLDDIVGYLVDNPDIDVEHHQFKGALYLILGENKQSLITKRSWEVMGKLWPAIIRTPHCEKPSVNSLYDSIMAQLHKDFETVELIMKVTPKCIELARTIWDNKGGPACLVGRPSEEEMKEAVLWEERRNEENLKNYYNLVSELVNIANNENLFWKFQQVCFDLLSLLIRYDVRFPANAVKLFVDNLNNSMINARRTSVLSVSAILKQQKRIHPLMVIDPNSSTLPRKAIEVTTTTSATTTTTAATTAAAPAAAVTTSMVASDSNYTTAVGYSNADSATNTAYNSTCVAFTNGTMAPIINDDIPSIHGVVNNRRTCVNGHVKHVPPSNNKWLMYCDHEIPTDAKSYDEFAFVCKTHIGYYDWPKPLTCYQPSAKQPKLGRQRSELLEDELPVYDAFNDVNFVTQFMEYATLEENKGKDKYRPLMFIFFKGLFRNYDDTVLGALKPLVERLVSDTNPESHETSHRCAAEIFTGLLRGSKHWTFDKREKLWQWLLPVLKQVLSSLSVESIKDWGTAIATASANQDPRKLKPLFELLMENPLNEVGGSFGDSSRLYLLQAAIVQQEWRVSELSHRLLKYLSNHLMHPYKNVRDRIASFLSNLFLFDVKLYQNSPANTSPQMNDFIDQLLPLLLQLLTIAAKTTADDDDDDEHQQQQQQLQQQQHGQKQPQKETSNANTSGDGRRKVLIRLCKTVLKMLNCIFTRMYQTDKPAPFKLLPVIATLEGDISDVDLSRECSLTLAVMSNGLLTNEQIINRVFLSIEEVSLMPSWRARSTSLIFLQRCTFQNFFVLQESKFIEKVKGILLPRLLDEHVEVRELAGVTFSGLFQCGYLQVDSFLLNHFKNLASTKLVSKKKKNRTDVVVAAATATTAAVTATTPVATTTSTAMSKILKPDDLDSVDSSIFTDISPTNDRLKEASSHAFLLADGQQYPAAISPAVAQAAVTEYAILKRHAGVIGMCSCVSASPYDVPAYVPDLLMLLSEHLNDPQPIQMTAKKTLAGFKRTHLDNWHDLKQKFTDDQLAILTELLVSPNYYA